MRNLAEPDEELTPVQGFFCGACGLTPGSCECACSRCGCDLSALPARECLGCAEALAQERRCRHCGEERDGENLTCGRAICDAGERYDRRCP